MKHILIAALIAFAWSAADMSAASAGDIGAKVDRTLRSIDEPNPKPPKNPCKGLTAAQKKASAACQKYLASH